MDQLVACRVCGGPLDRWDRCPACSRAQQRIRQAIAVTSVIAMLLLALVMALVAVTRP